MDSWRLLMCPDNLRDTVPTIRTILKLIKNDKPFGGYVISAILILSLELLKLPSSGSQTSGALASIGQVNETD